MDAARKTDLEEFVNDGIAANGGAAARRRRSLLELVHVHRVAKLLYSPVVWTLVNDKWEAFAHGAPGAARTREHRGNDPDPHTDLPLHPSRTAGVWMWFVFLNLMNITTATLSMCAKRPTRACSAAASC